MSMLNPLLLDASRYRLTCANLAEYLRKGRGGIYLGKNDILGATVSGQQMIVDSRHAPSLKPLYVPPPGEVFIIALLSQLIKAGMVCVDIDAGCGYYSMLLAAFTGPLGKVYSFEAIPECHRLIGKNAFLNAYEWIEAIPAYVSNNNDNMEMECFDTDYHFFFLDKNECEKKHFIAHSIILDEYFADKESTVDFIKINREHDLLKCFKSIKEAILFNSDLLILVTINPKFLFSDADVNEFFDLIFNDYHLKAYVLPHMQEIDIEDISNLSMSKQVLFSKRPLELI